MNIIPLDIIKQKRPSFQAYSDLLIKWNKKINLTSITRPDEIEEIHFIDSLSCLPYLVSRETLLNDFCLLDVGAGAGFPGIPIKVACPDIEVTLAEAIKKKCDFMKEVVRRLGLTGATVLNKRLNAGESVGLFNLIVSRGTFGMDELIRIGAKNLKPRGLIVSFKGDNVAGEVAAAEREAAKHHMGPIVNVPYKLPYSGRGRTLLVTEFISTTP